MLNLLSNNRKWNRFKATVANIFEFYNQRIIKSKSLKNSIFYFRIHTLLSSIRCIAEKERKKERKREDESNGFESFGLVNFISISQKTIRKNKQ